MGDSVRQIKLPQHADSLQCTFVRRDLIVLVLLAIMLITAAILRLMIGQQFGWPMGQVLEFRGYRLVASFSVGAALSVSGVLLQALLRNPLASPYIIGVSSGAAIGVVASYFGATAWLGVSQPICAMLAAGITLLVIYALSQKRGWVDPLGLLLVGVIINAINGAVIMFVHYLKPYDIGVDLNRWLMGFINPNLSWTMLTTICGISIVGIVIATMRGRAIDVATFSDTEAHAMGLHLGRLRLGMFALAGVLTACSVVLAGPVGFVGLICPHGVRLLIGPRHTPLVIGSALAGGLLMISADVGIKLLQVYGGSQGLMPVGIIMALAGGPIFLLMLRKQLGQGGGV